MPAYQPLVTLAAAFAAGIAADRCCPWRAEAWWLAGVVLLAAWAVAWRLGKLTFAACFLLAATAMLGAARHHGHWHGFPAGDFGRAVGAEVAPVCFEAVVLQNPRWRPAPPPTPLATFERGDQTEFDVRVASVRDGRRWRPLSGRAGVTVDGHLPNVQVGDRLRILGHVQRPQPPRNPGEFDFAAQQRAEGKLARVWVDHPDAVTIIARGSPWSLMRQVNRLRDAADRALWRYVPEERAGLASALVLGTREQLDRERVEAFFLTGTIHILAISGLNVGILAGGFWLVVRGIALPRRTALLLAMMLVAFYAILTGGETPVVRAAILVIAFCLGQFLGRPLLAFNGLAAAALAVLAANPAELFDAGAQLSFLAVGVLALVGPRVAGWQRPPRDPLARLIAQTRPWPQRAGRAGLVRLAQGFTASLAVWLAVLPLTMYRFHLVSPEAIVLNLAIAVPVAVALYAGFGVLIGHLVFPPLAYVCGMVCGWGLGALEGMVQFAQTASPLHFWTPGPAAWWVIGGYAGLAAWASFPHWRPPPRWQAALVAVWIALGLAPPNRGFPHVAPEPAASERVPIKVLGESLAFSTSRPLGCTFISVGHGVSVLVEFPNGRTLLYDAGGLGPPTASARAIAAVLWSHGHRRVDAVVLSHADADHYNALPELLKRFTVGVVYVSPVMFQNETPALTALREAIWQAEVPLREVCRGDRMQADQDTRVEVLHPPRRGVAGSDNANSIVLALDCQGRRVLLTGDLEGRPLEELLEEEPVAYDLALAPHHGSHRSNPPGFAAWASPAVTVISGDESDRSAAVQNAYRGVGGRVFHTAQHGAVRVVLRGDALQTQTWRNQPLPNGE